MSTETTHINTDKQQDRTERSRRVPALRFKEFEAKWEKLKLRDVSSYFNGGSFENDVKDEGKYELITLKSVDMGGNLAHSNKFLDICVPTLRKGTLVMILSEQSPGLLGMTALISSDDKYVLNQRVAEIRPNQKVESYFLSMAINRNQRFFSKYGAGTKVQNISKPNVENYSFLCPNLPEQQKIASFLSAVDEKIQHLTRKKDLVEQYKKAVMQQLFSGKVRFKDENGKAFPKWEEKKLGEYLMYKSERNEVKKIELVLSVSNKKGFISQDEQFDGYSVASKDLSNYKIVYKNDIAYNPSRINVGSIARLNNFEVGIVSPMYIVFGLKDELDPIFFENQYTTHRFKHLIKVGCSGSVRDSLNFEDLANFKFRFPSIQEQQKIANYLSSIDNKIEILNKQITQTQAFKKGLLQQMFV